MLRGLERQGERRVSHAFGDLTPEVNAVGLMELSANLLSDVSRSHHQVGREIDCLRRAVKGARLRKRSSVMTN